MLAWTFPAKAIRPNIVFVPEGAQDMDASECQDAIDFEALGDGLWQRFNQKDLAEHTWYYSTIAEALRAEPPESMRTP